MAGVSAIQDLHIWGLITTEIAQTAHLVMRNNHPGKIFLDETMKNSTNDLSHHILPNSATMVGVCIMVISIVKSMPPDMVSYLIDKALAIDSVLFLISALFSFLSIRLEHSTLRLERWAEMIFILGLVSMTMIAVIFSFEIV